MKCTSVLQGIASTQVGEVWIEKPEVVHLCLVKASGQSEQLVIFQLDAVLLNTKELGERSPVCLIQVPVGKFPCTAGSKKHA